MPRAASDGTRLNLAAELAQVAAGLQKVVSSRKATQDTAMVKALAEVREAIRHLMAAVRVLADEVADDEDET